MAARGRVHDFPESPDGDLLYLLHTCMRTWGQSTSNWGHTPVTALAADKPEGPRTLWPHTSASPPEAWAAYACPAAHEASGRKG